MRRTACIVSLCILLATLLYPAKGLASAAVHRRWIIVTTINYPTESIRILANMTDWKVSQNISDFNFSYLLELEFGFP